MSKLYFTRDNEFCYPLWVHKQHMKDDGIDELTLYPAKRTKVNGFIFCRHFQLVSNSDGCGKQCDEYKPRNGKSGACKNLGGLYEPDFDKPLIITA